MKTSEFVPAVLPYIKNSILNPLFISRNATRRFLRLATGHIGKDVLDVGCGEKEFSDTICGACERYVGLEYPASRAAMGRPRNPPEVYGDASDLPFDSDRFDTVLCLCVLEHVVNPARVLQECKRVVKPGGHVLVAVPLSDRIHCAPYDFYRFTPYGLRRVAAEAELECVEIANLTGTFGNVAMKLSLYVLHNWIFTKAETYEQRTVRLWMVPLGVAVCALVQCAGIALDTLHRDDHDAEQYFAILRKR